MGGFLTNHLPPSYLPRKIHAVHFVDFEGMGIPCNLRGITKGTPAEAARQAFYDPQKLDHMMYSRLDVTPINACNTPDDSTLLLDGLDRPGGASGVPRTCPRELYYENTVPIHCVCSVHGPRTFILFPIDTADRVAGLLFGDITCRK
ncbi:MAG: hypothetical protein FWE12_08680 [Oscillospiraceae bacterium]|nr:hypothetical protein [Oscillospiraceae bacterium]